MQRRYPTEKVFLLLFLQKKKTLLSFSSRKIHDSR